MSHAYNVGTTPIGTRHFHVDRGKCNALVARLCGNVLDLPAVAVAIEDDLLVMPAWASASNRAALFSGWTDSQSFSNSRSRASHEVGSISGEEFVVSLLVMMVLLKR
jgi:hypothetical protein